MELIFLGNGTTEIPDSEAQTRTASCTGLLQSDCTSVPGCVWQPNVLQCSNITNRDTCQGKSGCKWNFRKCYGEAYCSFTNSVCPEGCTYEPAKCTGNYVSGGTCVAGTQPTCSGAYGNWSLCSYVSPNNCQQTRTNTCGETQSRSCTCPTTPTSATSSNSCKYCINRNSSGAECRSRSTCNPDIPHECATRNDCGYTTQRPICSSAQEGIKSSGFQCMKDHTGTFQWVELKKYLGDGVFQQWLAIHNSRELSDLNRIILGCNSANCRNNNCNLNNLKQCLRSKGIPDRFINNPTYFDNTGFNLSCGNYVLLVRPFDLEMMSLFLKLDPSYNEKGWVSDYLSGCNYSQELVTEISLMQGKHID